MVTILAICDPFGGGVRMRSSILVSSLMVSLLLAGCSSDEDGTGGGTSGAGGSGGAGGAEDDSYGSSICGQCVRDACTAEINGCLADPECPAYLECLDACPLAETGDADPTCADACPRGTGTESQRAAAALDACRDPGPGAACEACGVPDRTGVPAFPELNQTGCPASTEDNGCFICQDEQCCQTQDACSANADCQAYKDCFRAPDAGDNAFYDCGLLHPEGVALFAPAYVCAEYHCAVGMENCDKSKRDACFTCLYDVCGTEWAALNRTHDGFMLSWCIGGCAVGDDACDQACFDMYPAAAGAALALGECLLAGCTGIC